MASTMSNVEMRDLARRLTDDDYRNDDSQRNVEDDRVSALEDRVTDLKRLVLELVGRIIP
jgi:hypothetical protein